MNPFAPPPSPAERLEYLKKRRKLLESAMPLVRQARATLRELSAIGFGDAHGHVKAACKELAILEDCIEHDLCWPEQV